MAEPVDSLDLLPTSQDVRVAFLDKQMTLCASCIELAHTELQSGDRTAAASAASMADEAYIAAVRFLPQVENADVRVGIAANLANLRKKLAAQVALIAS